jgi:hypothetical protein
MRSNLILVSITALPADDGCGSRVTVGTSGGLRADVCDVLLEATFAAAMAGVDAGETGSESGDGSEREENHQKRSAHGRSPQTE